MSKNDIWIQTVSGTKFHLLEPREKDVSIQDIAHALSRLCRFTGHTREHYSVAQHSVLVSYYVPEPARLWGLMHDAAEAYIGDLSQPLKQLVRQLSGSVLDDVEERIAAVIRRRFGISFDDEISRQVHAADIRLLASEAQDVLPMLHPDWTCQPKNGFVGIDEIITPWRGEFAKMRFLERFKELFDE